MEKNAPYLLSALALVFAVIGLIKPTWPMVAVAVLLLSVAVMLVVPK